MTDLPRRMPVPDGTFCDSCCAQRHNKTDTVYYTKLLYIIIYSHSELKYNQYVKDSTEKGMKLIILTPQELQYV
jgi:hypothetical protein